jgi:hypothetical protein
MLSEKYLNLRGINGKWRLLYNMEIRPLNGTPNIVRAVKFSTCSFDNLEFWYGKLSESCHLKQLEGDGEMTLTWMLGM